MLKIQKRQIILFILFIFLTGCSRISFRDPELPINEELPLEENGVEEELEPREYLGITLPQRVSTFNPIALPDALSASQVNMIGEGIYRKLSDDSVVPGVIDEELTVINDNVIEFTFKEDLRWSNGDPLIAEDFVLAWENLVNPLNNHYYADILNGIVNNAKEVSTGEKVVNELGIEVMNENTLRIELVESFEAYDNLREVFSFPALYPLPSNFLEDKDLESYGTSATNTLSNGPYIVNDWQAGWETWQFNKNPEYWNSDEYPSTAIFYQINNSRESAESLFDRQYFDMMMGFADFSYSVEPTSLFKLQFNQEDLINELETPFSHHGIRELTYKAVNLEDLLDHSAYNFRLANSIVPPGVFDLNDQPTDETANDNLSNKFQEILAEEDYEGIEVELLVDESRTSSELANEIKRQIESTIDNFVINITSLPNDLLNKRINSRQYDFALVYQHNWSANDIYSYYAEFVTDHSMNRTGYSNAEYDELLTQSNVASIMPEDVVLRAEELLKEDYAVKPLVYISNDNVYRSEVANLEDNVYSSNFDFKGITFTSGPDTIPLNP